MEYEDTPRIVLQLLNNASVLCVVASICLAIEAAANMRPRDAMIFRVIPLAVGFGGAWLSATHHYFVHAGVFGFAALLAMVTGFRNGRDKEAKKRIRANIFPALTYAVAALIFFAIKWWTARNEI